LCVGKNQHSHNPRVHAEQTLCRLSHPTDTSVNLIEEILAEGAAIQKKLPAIPGNLAPVGFCFNQEDCFIWPDLSGVAIGRTGAKPDDNMIQIAVFELDVIQDEITIKQQLCKQLAYFSLRFQP